MRIRSHLLLLAFGVILPVAAFAVFLTTLLVAHEQRTFADGAVERLRSTMNAIDAQVQGQIAVLRAVAASRALDTDDMVGFEAIANRVLRTQDAWTNVLLASPDGRQIVNAAAPWRVKENARILESGLTENVTKARAPVVGSVMTGPGTKRQGINVAVPVMRNGEVVYIVIAFLRPDLFLAPIEKQGLRKGWVSGVVDRHGAFIARVPPPATPVAAPAFLEAMKRAPEGWYRGITADGQDAFTAHITSRVTNWSIGLGIPAEEVLVGARRTAWSVGGGIAASLVLAALFALWLGRRIAAPVVALAEGAPGIATGTQIDTKGLERVAEVATVARALNSAAAAVRERQTLLEREKKALLEADRAKDEFIAMMSHELRNPLAALSSASQLLDIVAPNHESAQHAREVIKRQTRHTARLIEDLLDVSRVVMGKAYLQMEVFDLAAAAAAVVDSWRSLGRLERHRVTLDCAPAWIRADRARIEQIISNLLDNALKFSPDQRAVAVACRVTAGQATLTVSDEGAGLSAEMLERVFDLFVQGAQGLARKSGGMGIGLALVRRLAELQGGSVAVASEGEGHGCVFTVRFPSVPAQSAQAPAQTGGRAPKRRRILVIDDNEDMRKTFAASLVHQGHEVFQARDGSTGVALAHDVSPEVAIIDIGLPDIDGYEVAKRLRSNAATLRVGLVAMTGYGQRDDKQKALAAGFDEHLTKPVAQDALDEAIALAGARHAAASRPIA